MDAAGVAPKAFRLMPLGRFRAADGSGRPKSVPEGWHLDKAGAERISARLSSRASRRVIDYEHQTLLSADNGKPAPAAGWFGHLEVRQDGLYVVDGEWTASAAAMIAAGEYRYVSPVFSFDAKSGEVLDIAHAALTNNPGLDGLTDLARLSALFTHPEEEASPMKLLLAALGLAATATESEAITALEALKSSHTTELAVLRADAGRVPDPAKYVELATLTGLRNELVTATTELNTLKSEKQAAEVDKIVVAALSTGKLTPATESWARDLGKKDLAALTAYIDAASVVVKPGETPTSGKAPEDGKTHQLNDVETAVMKALGLTAEQFAAGKKED